MIFCMGHNRCDTYLNDLHMIQNLFILYSHSSIVESKSQYNHGTYTFSFSFSFSFYVIFCLVSGDRKSALRTDAHP